MTAGDSRALIKSINRNELAASPTGFMKDSTYHRRINSGFGFSHLLISGLEERELSPGGEGSAYRFKNARGSPYQIHAGACAKIAFNDQGDCFSLYWQKRVH